MLKKVRTRIREIFAAVTLLSVELIILLAIFGGALVVFIGITEMVFKDNKSDFDLQAFKILSGSVSDINTDVMQFFTFLGTHIFLIPANILLVAYFLFIKRHRWYSIKIPVVALSSLVLMFSLKYLFRRSRPLTPLLEQARGYSFPSGHALISFTFYGLLIYLAWRNVKNIWFKWLTIVALALLIFVIGLSRVYLRVHYASDVIAGYCVGCMWLLLSLWILGKIEKFSYKKVGLIVEEEPSFVNNS
ncbi:MAG: phosphatase PAP2 family protein [Ginsengibacter sp.]